MKLAAIVERWLYKRVPWTKNCYRNRFDWHAFFRCVNFECFLLCEGTLVPIIWDSSKNISVLELPVRQSAAKNPPKINPKSIPTCILFSIAFGLIVWLIFVRFSTPIRSTIHNNSIKTISTTQQPKNINVQKTFGFYNMVVPLARLGYVRELIKNDSTASRKQLWNQCSNLDRFWNQLGSVLGWLRGPWWGIRNCFCDEAGCDCRMLAV